MSQLALFEVGALRAVELDEPDLPALQAFFDANPDYFVTVNGQPPRPDEARQEFADRPPAGLRFERCWSLGFVDEAGSLVGMASLLSDFLADGVWHIGLFIVATSLHGSGIAATLYHGLEAWMARRGAAWIRLGAVLGNTRAERFWGRMGYTEVRRRFDVPTGARTNTIRVFVKPLEAGTLADYLQLVERDRPDSRLP